MSALPQSPGRKLKLFQQRDPLKEWWSLGETRYCAKCGRLFTGHDIGISEDKDEVPAFPLPDFSVSRTMGGLGVPRSCTSELKNPNPDFGF